MNATVPPGPTTPRPLQTLRWIYRPGAMLEDCRRRYGDMFTLRIANEGTWVFLADPEAERDQGEVHSAKSLAGEPTATSPGPGREANLGGGLGARAPSCHLQDHAGADGVVGRLVDQDEGAGGAVAPVLVDEQRRRQP